MHDSRRRELALLLKRQGITDSRVLDAIAIVPRHRFVDAELADQAYENRPLPIGAEQTISQPFVQALSLEALELRGGEKVLEVGTGSGYQTALLANLACEVHTVEANPTLAARAAARLVPYTNVTCHAGDGTEGLPGDAPFDAMVVSAAAPRVPPPLLDQLRVGGRMVIPVGGRDAQVLVCLVRPPPGDEPLSREIAHVRFVPLVGTHGWSPAD